MTAKWEAIETFSIESATGNNLLYANGHQSIRLRIGIKVVDINNRPVAVSEKERLTIKLVNYHGGKEIKYRDPNETAPLNSREGEWDWSIANIGDYSYFPAPGSRSLSAVGGLSANTAYIDVYVRSISQVPATFSVRITREDGVPFESRNKSGGSVELRPVRPPVHRVADYQFEKVTIHPDVGMSGFKNQLAGLHYYRFGLAVAGENLEFKHVTLSPGGLLADRSIVFPGRVGVGIVGYTQPDSLVITWPHVPHGGPRDLILWKPRPRPGQILFVRAELEGSYGARLNSPVRKTRYDRCSIDARDVYGNRHQMTMRFDPKSNDPQLV